MSKTGLWRYIRNWRFSSLLIRNFLLIAAVILLCVCLVAIPGYMQVQGAVREETGQAYAAALLRHMDQVHSMVDNVHMAMMQLSVNRDVIAWLRPSELAIRSYDNIERVNRILNQLAGYNTMLMPALANLMLYSLHEDYVLSSTYGGAERSRYADSSWYSAYQRYTEDTSLSTTFRTATQNGTERRCLTLLQAMPIMPRNEHHGVVVADIDLEHLFFGSGATKDAFLCVTDGTGAIIANNDMSLYGQAIEALGLPKTAVAAEGSTIITYQERSMMLTVRHEPALNWWYYAIDPLDHYDARLQQTLRTAWGAAGGMGLLGLALALFVSVRMFQPVHSIMQELEARDADGVLPMEARVEASNEIAFLSKMILHTLDRNQALTDTLADDLRALNKARLLMLQSQINPHFLYNTLESINWMSIDILGSENEVSDALCSLSELLRASLKAGSVIPLVQEVHQAALYIKLQQLRFGSQLAVDWHLDEDTLSDTVPVMVLQPLIENSIKHGIIPARPMHIAVHAAHEEGRLVLTVADDGQGMPAETLARLRAELSDEALLSQAHVGLLNVQLRLRVLYGAAGGIAIASEPSKGLEVKITIPNIN